MRWIEEFINDKNTYVRIVKCTQFEKCAHKFKTTFESLKKLYKTIRLAEQKLGRESLNKFFEAVAQEG